MDLIVSWVVYPAVLVAVCLGFGLLVEAACRARLPTGLLPAVGFAAMIVVTQFLTLVDATAELAIPAAVATAALGFALGARGRGFRFAPWGLAAALAVFAVYAAPIVISGEATLAGFIKLDDTATWLALTDRVLEHGRSLDGLAPSTYEATLQFNLADGYPIGVFLPFGIASQLIGVDVAWTIQPYMACLAVILALALWTLARPLLAAPALRGAAALIGAVPALLYGYYLWGGVKELAAAALIATLAALVVRLADRRASEWRALVAPALVAAALVGVVSGGAGIWLVPLLGPAALLIGWRVGPAATAARAAAFTFAVALLSLPVILAGALLPPTSSPLSDDAARGNLAAPLEPAQAAGIWPAGDFRFDPGAELLTYLLIAVATLAAAGAIVWWLRRGEIGIAVYVLGTLAGCAVLVVVGSPWVEGKALAIASAAIPFAAMVAAGSLALAGRRLAAALLAAAVAGGVLWSAALAYRDVNLAPRAQLEELEEIGELVAGEGPTLVTEYSPYAARHFLRDGDPESISELRRRPIPLRDGGEVAKGEGADIDEIDPAALAVYEAIVARRDPGQSRPPGTYELTWSGEFYELWQRRRGPAAALLRLGLGEGADPVAVPRCERVLALAASVGAGGRLLASRRRSPLVIPLAKASYPDGWRQPGASGSPSPSSPGVIAAGVDVERAGRYELALGGSIRPAVVARIDGELVGERHHELNNLGGYVAFGEVELERGRHTVEVEFEGADLAPGSGGSAGPVGPLVLDPGRASKAKLIEVEPGAARSRLCGRRWDWIEAHPLGS